MTLCVARHDEADALFAGACSFNTHRIFGINVCFAAYFP
jgi:hypothetical protein